MVTWELGIPTMGQISIFTLASLIRFIGNQDKHVWIVIHNYFRPHVPSRL
ncbi:hypothetical protein HanRHA438_Chr11g0513861 [Helianthus annuus]|uniref:Uncharacterized protein n=1 Tax=Helianthus annuus TaxID=4232 RepID=A0A9K3HRB9_HELAN|nr:hypothetical protein HanXRQr2_Chr11g0501121 [Helianthus annuus]KAJ0871556.1 hypothetical protein HanRHA438_Chr11g0513861 [Helianthus annuus]KAJ0875960.1 hypothetical protein HanPSC8_Chr11g0482891 [Helianthus annuus]